MTEISNGCHLPPLMILTDENKVVLNKREH